MASEVSQPPASSLNTLAIDRSAARGKARRGKPWFRRVWPYLLALVLVAAAVGGVRIFTAPPQVEVATVASTYPSQALAVLNATGRVSASTRASIASKATGRLEWLGVVEGQHVKLGEVIARLEARDVSAQRDQAAAGVQAARANLGQADAERVNAEADLQRAQDLAERKFLSPSAVDQAQARVNKARAVVESQRAQIGVAQANLRAADVGVDQTLVRAPFNGVVLTKSANVGDIVTPFSSASGTTGAVVTMADMRTLEVEADVSETSIAKVSVGQPVEIQLDAFPDLRLAGSVSRIVPTVDRSKATLLVKLKFEESDDRVLPDMSAKVAFLSRPLTAADRKPVPAVRPEGVTRRSIDGAPRDVVFVVEEPGAGNGAPGAAGVGVGTSMGTSGAADAAAGKPAEATPQAGKRAGTDARAAVRVRRVPVTIGARVGDLLRIDTLVPGSRVVLNPSEALADGGSVVVIRK